MALVLIFTACAQRPPERTPLPDLESVLPEPPECRLSVGEPRGARVVTVFEGSPAEAALSEGDVLDGVGEIPVADADELVAAVGSHQPGDTVAIDFERDGKVGTIELDLASHPSDEQRPYLGVSVRTAHDTIGPEEADHLVRPGATSRTVEIEGALFVFDPVARTWQHTGLTVPQRQNWVSTTTGFYGARDETPAVLFDLVTGDELQHDGFQGWDPRRIVGSLGDKIILAVTTAVPDQPGFINIAIAGFDPTVGETLWVSPVLAGFGVPVAAYGSADGSALLAVGTDQETGDEAGVELYDSNGSRRTVGELAELGSPIGWFDDTSIGFRSDEVVSILDVTTGSTSTLTVPSGLLETRLLAVGDGKHVIAVEGRALLLDDLTSQGEVGLLAEDCVLGAIGAPGWGL